jgi:hypothetical protein
MPITSRKPGPRAASWALGQLWYALARLNVKWRKLTATELERHLRHVIIAERHGMPHKAKFKEMPTHRYLQPRLRRRRLEVANALLAHGTRINKAVFCRVLPRRKQWPGALALVGKHAMNSAQRGDALYISTKGG